MFSKQKQNRSDLLEKGTFSRKRHERNFSGAYSAPYFDLGGGNRRIDKLKSHQAVFNISALFVLYVF